MTHGKTRVFIMDWRDHSDKDQEWYDRRRRKATEERLLHIFDQEVDRDYTASMEGIIIPAAWVSSVIDAHIKFCIKTEGAKMPALDVVDEGGGKNCYAARKRHCAHRS